jgi:DNA polymerase V
MKNRIFALVDANNFYVSCERVFNPHLVDKPVVVLSNNDGCVISRSQEAKDLGVPMGMPVFQLQSLINEHGIQVCSANFTLYADLSRRVVEELKSFTSEVEVYSVDESFIELTNAVVARNYGAISELRQVINTNLGIPTSIGVAPTKTLAKCMNRIAKKHKEFRSVANYFELDDVDYWLSKIDIEDVWGIGRQYVKMLRNQGITNAYQLKVIDRAWAKHKMTVQGERLVLELNGICCRPLLKHPPEKKQIICSRAFGRKIYEFEPISEAIASYTARACEKMRLLKLHATEVSVFIRTNGYGDKPHYSNTGIVTMIYPTNNTSTAQKYTHALLKKIFMPGYEYYKAGVVFTKITPESVHQLDMLGSLIINLCKSTRKSDDAMDILNAKYGRNTVKMASQGTDNAAWKMKQNHLSRLYTTDWKQLAEIDKILL